MRAAMCLAVLAAFVCAAPGRAEMALVVDSDWTAYLVNEGNVPVYFNAYHLHSDEEVFDPAGWVSIEDQLAGDFPSLVARFGPLVRGFVEANPFDKSMAELALRSYAVWQPGERLSIGKPFLASLAEPPDIVFEYLDVIDGFADFHLVRGAVRFSQAPSVPEPSAIALAALGAGLLSMAGRGRRAQRSRGPRI
jgi:hypothetical protein